MTTLFAKAWDDFVRPMIKRPNQLQVAALCYRKVGGKKEVLLVTSRGSGRWILPKGWPMEGMTAAEAARMEAWEEAGVEPAKISRKPVGTFEYTKDRDEDMPLPCDTNVYPVKVANLADEFPEAGERERKWFSPEDAANLVDDEGLKDILRHF